MGELLRFPLERRQQQPGASLPVDGKVIPFKQRHVREFAGIPVVSVEGAPNGWLSVAYAFGGFSFGTGGNPIDTGSRTGGHPSTG